MKVERTDTRSRILDAAIGLFNADGTASVSTNHIARAAGISPGNLYYHFKNKEDVIRAILERMYEAWGRVWQLPADRTLTMTDFGNAIRRSMDIEREYRFFYRELVALIRRDPQLGRRHRAIQQQRTGEQARWSERFAAAGVLRLPTDPHDARALLTGAWVISNYWVSFLEASGAAVGRAQMDAGVDLIMRLLRPYLVGADARQTRRISHTRSRHDQA